MLSERPRPTRRAALLRRATRGADALARCWAAALPRCGAVALAFYALSGTPAAHAQPAAEQASEESIKAAFLYKFADYVDWPDAARDTNAPFRIAVIGDGRLADELARATSGRDVAGRPIDVRRVIAGETLETFEVLFVGAEEEGRLEELLAPATTLPILTVTESDDGLERGSIINFTIEQRRVRFEVSLAAADQSGLRLNARLLAVAARVLR
jgi:hypothetical protein